MATLRQKLAVAKLSENPRSVSAVMREVGYSHYTATRPQDLTNSIGFKELMEQNGLDDKFLQKKHKELLSVPKKTRRYKSGGDIVEEESLDTYALSKGLDMAYKVKGHYAPEKVQQEIVVMTPEDVQNRINNLKLKK